MYGDCQYARRLLTSSTYRIYDKFTSESNEIQPALGINESTNSKEIITYTNNVIYSVPSTNLTETSIPNSRKKYDASRIHPGHTEPQTEHLACGRRRSLATVPGYIELAQISSSSFVLGRERGVPVVVAGQCS